MQERLKTAEREIGALRGQVVGGRFATVSTQPPVINGVPVVATRVAVASKDELRSLADKARERFQSGVLIFGAEIDGLPSLLVAVTKDRVAGGLNTGHIVREIVPLIDGRGGGRPDLAEAGGKDLTGLDAALAAGINYIRTVSVG